MAYLIPTFSWITAVLGISGVSGTLASANLSFLLGLVPFGIILFGVAPYFVWKTTRKCVQDMQGQLQELTTPRLEVAVEPEEVEALPDGEVRYWWHLKVKNPTGKAISGCYCKIVEFRSKAKINAQLPRPGIRYPWSTLAGGALARTTCKIGSKDFDVVDIAMCQHNEPDVFYTPILGKDQYTRHLQFPLPSGKYEINIQVGSDDLNFQPTLRTIEIDFSGGYQLSIMDITK